MSFDAFKVLKCGWESVCACVCVWVCEREGGNGRSKTGWTKGTFKFCSTSLKLTQARAANEHSLTSEWEDVCRSVCVCEWEKVCVCVSLSQNCKVCCCCGNWNRRENAERYDYWLSIWTNRIPKEILFILKHNELMFTYDSTVFQLIKFVLLCIWKSLLKKYKRWDKFEIFPYMAQLILNRWLEMIKDHLLENVWERERER